MPSSYTNLHYRVIFATRELRPVIEPGWREELQRYLGGIVLRQGGILHEVRAWPDHIHLLARFRAEPSVAALLRLLKANSSKWINRRRFVMGKFAWAPGYGAYSVSASRLETIKHSVRNKNSYQHFEEERRALTGGHCPKRLPDTHTQLIYHIVFGTKYRQPILHARWRGQLYEHVRELVNAHCGTVVEINGMPDHVHLLAEFKAEPSVAVMVRDVKAYSSMWVKDQRYLQERFDWQVGYAAFSVSCSQIERVRRYIQRQQEHHRRYSFDDEMKAFLGRQQAADTTNLQTGCS